MNKNLEEFKKQLGKNIRNQRNSYGESQMELANFLNSNKERISNYERGTRMPDVFTLCAIANRYHCSLDEIVYDKKGQIDKEESIFSETKISDIFNEEYFNRAFQIVCTKESLNDKYFKKAYTQHKKIYNILVNGKLTLEKIDSIINDYDNSYNNNKTEESLANKLALIIFKKTIFPKIIGNIEFIRKAQKNPSILKVSGLKKILANDIENMSINNHVMPEDKKDFYNTLSLFKQVKTQTPYDGFSEYYIAIWFTFGIVNNGKTIETNRNVGSEMMLSLYALENQYALNYYEYILANYMVNETLT